MIIAINIKPQSHFFVCQWIKMPTHIQIGSTRIIPCAAYELHLSSCTLTRFITGPHDHSDGLVQDCIISTVNSMNRKCQYYVYVKWEYWSTGKHYLIYENKVNENKLLSCYEALRCETIKKLFSFMSNLQSHYHFKLDFLKVYRHTGGKWLIHGTKRRKDNQLQSLVLPCRISWKGMWTGHKRVRS